MAEPNRTTDPPDAAPFSAFPRGQVVTRTLPDGRRQDFVWTAYPDVADGLGQYPAGTRLGYWKPDTTPTGAPRSNTGTSPEERAATRAEADKRRAEERAADDAHRQAQIQAQADQLAYAKERDDADREERKARAAEAAAQAANNLAEAKRQHDIAQAWAEKKDEADRRERTADRALRAEEIYAESRRRDRELQLKQDEFEAKQATEPGNYYNYAWRIHGQEPPYPGGGPAAAGPGAAPVAEADLAAFRAEFRKEFGREATDADWNDVAKLTGASNELIRTLPDRILRQFPTSRLAALSNEDLLPILRAHPEMLGAFSAERLATFGPGVIDAIRRGASGASGGADAAGAAAGTQSVGDAGTSGLTDQLKQQLAEWQAARTAKGEDPNDMAAFRAHVIAMGFPDPGIVTAPAPPAAQGAQAFMAAGEPGVGAGSPPGPGPALGPQDWWRSKSLAELEKYPDEALVDLPQSVLEAFRNEFLLARPALMAHLSPDRIKGTGTWAGKGTGFSTDVVDKWGKGAPAPALATPPTSAPPAAASPGPAPAAAAPAAGPAPALTAGGGGPGWIPAAAAGPSAFMQGGGPGSGPSLGMSEEQIVALANDFLRKQAGAPTGMGAPA